MIVNGRNFDVEYAIHNVSMECAKIQLQRNEMNGPIDDDITVSLDFLFNSYVYNFAYLSQKSDEEIKRLLEID